MFSAKLRPLTVRFANKCEVTLSKSLPAAIPKNIRTMESRRLGALMRGERQDESKLAIDILKDVIRAQDDAQTVFDQTLEHIETLKNIHTALTLGVYVAGADDPAIHAAIQAFGLKELLRKSEPDAEVVTSEFQEAIDAVLEAITELVAAVETARSRIEAAKKLSPKAAKAAFVFHEDLGALMRMGVDKYLPEPWKRQLPKEPLGIATQNEFDPADANIRASVLQRRLTLMLESERQRSSQARSAAKQKLDASGTLTKLREAHR